MDNKNVRNALRIASFLLQYPDNEWYQCLKEAEEEVKKIKHEAYAIPLLIFLKHTKQLRQLELAENYVNTFDFSKKANLYLTYHLLADKPERGMALLKLKKRYSDAGFEVLDRELPDFLPVVLEFAAIKTDEILKEYISVVNEIYTELSKMNSPYAHVLNSLLLIIQAEKTEDYDLAAGRCQ